MHNGGVPKLISDIEDSMSTLFKGLKNFKKSTRNTGTIVDGQSENLQTIEN